MCKCSNDKEKEYQCIVIVVRAVRITVIIIIIDIIVIKSAILLLAIPFLIKFLHGNADGLTKLIPSFKKFWVKYVQQNKLPCRTDISKRQMTKKNSRNLLQENIMIKSGKVCYTVNEIILAKYKLKGKVTLGDNISILDNSIMNTPLAMDIMSTLHSQENLTKLNNDMNNGNPIQSE